MRTKIYTSSHYSLAALPLRVGRVHVHSVLLQPGVGQGEERGVAALNLLVNLPIGARLPAAEGGSIKPS